MRAKYGKSYNTWWDNQKDITEKKTFLYEIYNAFTEKYPKVNFVLSTNNKDVKEAYYKMLHNHGSDFKTVKDGY